MRVCIGTRALDEWSAQERTRRYSEKTYLNAEGIPCEGRGLVRMRSVRERDVVTQGYRRSASPKCLRSGFSRKGRGAMRKEYGVSTQKEPFLFFGCHFKCKL